jgi:hypothetical protein
VFRLRRAARVRVSVVQVAPNCRRFGAFTVRGHRGVNRVVFRPRLHGRPLPLGTYRLIALARGRTVLGVTVVVAATRPSARALARARAANACATLRVTTQAIPAQARGPVGMPAPSAAAQGTPSARGGGSGSPAGETAKASVLPRGQALGAQFGKSAGGVDPTHAFLVAAAAIAILLLGLAALPDAALAEPRLAVLVGTRRIELALAGATTLLTAVLVYLATG